MIVASLTQPEKAISFTDRPILTRMTSFAAERRHRPAARRRYWPDGAADDPSLLGIKYWFVDEVVQTPQGAVDLADVFDSYVSTRGLQGNLLNGQMTAVPLEQLQPAHVQGAVCVGLLSSAERHEETRAAFVNAATAAGIPMRAVLERQPYEGGLRPFLSPHFNLRVELPLKTIVRGYSWDTMPITWRNRRTGLAKLKIREMGTRYLFIVFYVWLEKYFSRGDYRKR